MAGGGVPGSYQRATFRCVLPPDPDSGDAAIAFDTAYGALRLRLSQEDIDRLVGGLASQRLIGPAKIGMTVGETASLFEDRSR